MRPACVLGPSTLIYTAALRGEKEGGKKPQNKKNLPEKIVEKNKRKRKGVGGIKGVFALAHLAIKNT